MNQYPGLTVELKYWPPLFSPAFTSHTIFAGLSGSGKSNAAEFQIIQEVGKKKVIDFYDSGRFENMLYFFPEMDLEKVESLNKLTNRKMRPHPTPCEVVLISGKGLQDNPDLPGHNKEGQGVYLKAFREESLTLGDITYLLGKSEALQGFLSYIAYLRGSDEISFSELLKDLRNPKIRSKIPPSMLGSINRYMSQWKKSGMFSKKVDPISIKDSLMAKDKITSYSTAFLEPEEEAVAYSMILKEILKLKKTRQIPHRIRIYIREIAMFYINDGYELFRQTLFKVQREGRDIGIDITVDTQRPGDLPPTYRTQFGYYYLMKSNLKVAEQLSEVQEIPRDILFKIPKFEVGECIMLTGMRWDQPVIIPPTPHTHKVPGMDVLGMLRDKFGTVSYDAEDILKTEEDVNLLEEEVKDEGDSESIT